MPYQIAYAVPEEEMPLTFRDVHGRIGGVELYNDPTLADLSQRAYHGLKEKGPVYRNHAGVAVQFEDLDFDLQCGFMNCCVFPMDSIKARDTFEEGRLAEKEKRERKRMEWRKERERIRLAAMGKQGGGDLEMADVDGESEGSAPNSTSGRNGGTANRPFVPLDPHSQRPTAASEPGERPSETGGRPQPALYERMVWEDVSQTEARRHQPSVERWWHPSKTRSAERVQQVKDLGLDVFTPYAREVKRRVQLEHQRRWETQIKTKSQVERVLQ